MTRIPSDPPRNPDETPESPEGTPRWVKIAGIIALIVVILVLLMLVVGGGEHGPGRHGLGMAAEGTFLIQRHL